MPYIASNDGLTFQWRDPAENYELQAGDIDMGLEAPTEEQLAVAFPDYHVAKESARDAPQPTLADVIAILQPDQKAALAQRVVK